VNAVIDAALKSATSKKWEPIELSVWRGNISELQQQQMTVYNENYYLIKRETLPDGSNRLILKDKETGKIINVNE
jgi:hypothetical protein